MLWRRQRRLLAVAQFIAVLILIPSFVVMVWSVGDVPTVLAAWGISSPLPPLDVRDVILAPTLIGLLIAIFRTHRMLLDMRERAIMGDVNAAPPAKPLVVVDAPLPPLPVTLVWRRTRRSRLNLMIWFAITLAPLIGLGVLLAWAGIFDFIASQDGVFFWGLCGIGALGAITFSIIPFVILSELLRSPRGVVADDFGVSSWHGRETITWVDARLLEVLVGHARGHGRVFYTLYAMDGRRLTWESRAEDASIARSHRLIGSEINDSQQRAGAILVLAHAKTGLTPRTFDKDIADNASNLAAPGNLPFGKDAMPNFWPGTLALLVGMTCGCGVATLAMRSPVSPAFSLVAAATLVVSTLWSLALAVPEALTLPRRLTPGELPTWRAPAGIATEGVAQLQQARNRSWRLGMTLRALLMLIGSVAGIAVTIAAMVAGHIVIASYDAWMNLVWLVFAALISAVRVSGQFDRDEVSLLADAAGIQNLRSRRPQTISWADIAALRFTWSRAVGFRYTAKAQNNDEITWASQSRQWRDEEPDLATTGIHAPTVDGDAFAAIVAARTGLIPAQELE